MLSLGSFLLFAVFMSNALTRSWASDYVINVRKGEEPWYNFYSIWLVVGGRVHAEDEQYSSAMPWPLLALMFETANTLFYQTWVAIWFQIPLQVMHMLSLDHLVAIIKQFYGIGAFFYGILQLRVILGGAGGALRAALTFLNGA